MPEKIAPAAEVQAACKGAFDLLVAPPVVNGANEDLAAGVAWPVEVENASVAGDVVVADEGEAAVLLVGRRVVAEVFECFHLRHHGVEVEPHLVFAVLALAHNVPLQFDCHGD